MWALGGPRGSTAPSLLPSGRPVFPPWFLGSGPHGIFPDRGGPAGLLRHSGLCSTKASPGSGQWSQPDLEPLHSANPSSSILTSHNQPCSSAPLQLCYNWLLNCPPPTTITTSSPSLQLELQGPPLKTTFLSHQHLSLPPSLVLLPHTLAKSQPWINPPSLFFFFPLILQSC